MAGRPRWEPTTAQRRAARRLARLGIPEREVARHLRVDRKTLRASELFNEMADARLALRVKLLRGVLEDANQGRTRAVDRMLRLLSRADETSEEPPAAENGGEKAENDEKGDQNDGIEKPPAKSSAFRHPPV
jgi:hypothetical protein